MKKGFTMIELIFVIVILGILASVAIPRLAGTREDAEISAAVANLRTLLGDAAAYYAVKGDFNNRAGTADATWQELTSVPLIAVTGATAAVGTAATANLKVGDANDCIGVHIVEKTDTAPAHIKFTKKNGATGVCNKVLESKPVAAYINSVVKPSTGDAIQNAMAITSNTKIY